MSIFGKTVTWVKERMPPWNRHQTSNARSDRPRRDERLSSLFDSETFLKIPPFPMSYTSMYAIHQMETVSRTCTNNIKNETFRRGLEWKSKWTSKCPECNTTYTGKTPLDRCPECDPEPDNFFTLLGEISLEDGDIKEIEKKLLEGASATREMLQPDPHEYERYDKFIKKINSAGLSLIDVLKQFDEDLNIVDEGFFVVRKEYDYVTGYTDKDTKEFIYANPKQQALGLLPGTILRANVLEAFRGSPKILRKVIDQNNNMGDRWYKCIHCGMIVENATWGQDYLSVNSMPTAEPDERGLWVCPRCDHIMHDVLYFEMLTEYGDVRKFFIAGEVIHRHKWSTSTGYGEPPTLSNYPYQASLIYGITYIRDFLEQRKAPQGIIQIVTANVTKGMKRWAEEARKRQEDKQHIPVMFIEPEATGLGGTGQVKWVPIMQTLADMEWTKAREECRERISFFYGVSSKFISSSSGQTGANKNDGMTLVVSNRTIETEQQIIQSVLDEFIPMLGIRNYDLSPVPTEDRDIMKEEDIETKKSQRMQMNYAMGFEVDVNANGEWIFWKPAVSKEQQAMLKELITAKMQLENSIKMAEQSQEMMQSYETSNTEPSGDPEKNKQDPSNKDITKDTASGRSLVSGQPFDASPSDARIKAGNYQKPRARINGETVVIENPVGSTRKGTSKAGKVWETKMAADYGYILGTIGADKDHLDVFIRPDPIPNGKIYIVNQVVPGTGTFDEHKIMFGYQDRQEAKSGYMANYEKGWNGLGSVKEYSLEEWKTWKGTRGATKKIAKACPLCENLQVGDWDFVMQCFMKSIPIYTVEDENGVIDFQKSVIKRGDRYNVITGHTHKTGTEIDAPKGTAIRFYDQLETAQSLHYAITTSQKRRGEFQKEMPPDDWMKDSLNNNLGATQPLLHFIWNHWRDTEISKAFQSGMIGIAKADGKSEPDQIPKTTRAEGRTKTDIDQTPKSGSAYTPGQSGQYTCKHCGKTFQSKEELGGHQQKCPENPNSKGKEGEDAGEMFSPEQAQQKVELLLQAFLTSMAASHRPSNAINKKNIRR